MQRCAEQVLIILCWSLLIDFQHGFEFVSFLIVLPITPGIKIFPGLDNNHNIRVFAFHQGLAGHIAFLGHGQSSNFIQQRYNLRDIAGFKPSLDENFCNHEISPPLIGEQKAAFKYKNGKANGRQI
jgi:hypothetical protein